MANVDTIVFDKTGTITKPEDSTSLFKGKRQLSTFEEQLVASLVSNSVHPISIKIKHLLSQNQYLLIENFEEILGKGIEGNYEGLNIKLGSKAWIDKVEKRVEFSKKTSFF